MATRTSLSSSPFSASSTPVHSFPPIPPYLAFLATYYGYGTPIAKAANTPDNIEVKSPRSMDIFFYDNSQELAVFHILGSPSDALQVHYAFNFSAPTLAGKGVDIVLRDDPNDRTVTWDPATGQGTADFTHTATTSGFVLSGFPRDDQFCITYTIATTTVQNLDTLNFYSHDKPSSAYPSTQKILGHGHPILSVKTLTLCHTTCSTSLSPPPLPLPLFSCIPRLPRWSDHDDAAHSHLHAPDDPAWPCRHSHDVQRCEAVHLGDCPRFADERSSAGHCDLLRHV